MFSKFSYKRANKKYILISNLIGEYDASDPNDTSSPIRLHLGDKDDEFFEEFIFKSNNPDEVKVQKYWKSTMIHLRCDLRSYIWRQQN